MIFRGRLFHILLALASAFFWGFGLSLFSWPWHQLVFFAVIGCGLSLFYLLWLELVFLAGTGGYKVFNFFVDALCVEFIGFPTDFLGILKNS